jgi:hypothetical protein
MPSRPDKELILNEIRRLADVNGGVPLGRQRFEAATGIRESDWSGRFWVRWNDAVREAGYEPNPYNRALSDDDLLRTLAIYVRELGHYPVANELRMRSLEDPAFPNPKTFQKRGGRDELIRRLDAFCAAEPGLADVCDLLPATAPAEQESGGEPSNLVPGVVYLAKSGRYYKIGRSNDAGRRGYEIALQLPEALVAVHEIETDDTVGIERYWHHRFKDQRVRGEWFDLSAADVKAFKRRRVM